MDDDDVLAPEPPSMAWLLTFADLVSLLITFFVLLYSMKVVDEKKWDQLRGAFSGVFSVRDAIVFVRPESESSVEQFQLVESDNLSYIENLLATRFSWNEMLKDIKMTHKTAENQLVISLPNAAMFGPSNAEISPEGQEIIRETAEVLRHLDNRVEVAGYTDPYPVISTVYPTNWELAMLRALQVRRILKNQGVEVPPAVSYGDSRFDEINILDTPAERSLAARRVEIIIHGTE